MVILDDIGPEYKPRPLRIPDVEKKELLETYFEFLPKSSAVRWYFKKHPKRKVKFQENTKMHYVGNIVGLVISAKGLEKRLFDASPGKKCQEAKPKECAKYILAKGKREGKYMTPESIQAEILFAMAENYKK
jgi:hypothetical protein